jgi:hypothetical protein
MNTLGFNPWMYMEIQRRHEELINEAAQYRLLFEALKAGPPKMRSSSKILAQIGKGLTSLGTNLEVRFGSQSETVAVLNQQSNPGGCS